MLVSVFEKALDLIWIQEITRLQAFIIRPIQIDRIEVELEQDFVNTFIVNIILRNREKTFDEIFRVDFRFWRCLSKCNLT